MKPYRGSSIAYYLKIALTINLSSSAMCDLEKYNATELLIRNLKKDINKKSLYHKEGITINCVDDYEFKTSTRQQSKVFTCEHGIIDIGECGREYFLLSLVKN